jgi:hypothetical protein
MIVLTTLAYGTVHYWALGVFALTAAGLSVFGAWTEWFCAQSDQHQFNSMAGAGIDCAGLIQLLPLRNAADNAGLIPSVTQLSLDPYSTRLVLVQLIALFIFFMAALTFTDSPRRLRTLARTITIFGFCWRCSVDPIVHDRRYPRLLVSPVESKHRFWSFHQSTSFCGLYGAGVAIHSVFCSQGRSSRTSAPLRICGDADGVSLIMTNSRGASSAWPPRSSFWSSLPALPKRGETRAVNACAPCCCGAFWRPGWSSFCLWGNRRRRADVFSRFLGTVNAADPTTGRSHFWSVTMDVIKAHPVIGSGLGSFSVIYTRYDSRNGMYRLEQAHNDYLQILSDGGIVGGSWD